MSRPINYPPPDGTPLAPGQISFDAVFAAYRAHMPDTLAVVFTAISWRESAHIPTVHNADAATGDDSYGLAQINLRDAAVSAAMVKAGITPAMLQTADGNARAVALLWGGNNAILDEGWYILRDGYREAYEAALPAAMRAALRAKLKA